MAFRITLRAVAPALAAAALSLAVAQGAPASAAEHGGIPAHTTPNALTAPTTSAPADDNPFRAMELDGLKAEFRFMCPAGHCVGYWSLALTEDRLKRHYQGGEFFAYAPAKGEFGFFLDTDIAYRTVKDPRRVRLVDSDFTRRNPRVEVRYGNPDRPREADVVATATTWM
ncbi:MULTISPECIES: hypothetical protein [Streptomyces]|uniref:hypothetical protein n=1 Tax=Streptomyces TaxID=1883 RepID=UPI00163BBD05|nr:MULTISPECIES: hypothetical protein [Streptomyces]MBC2875723.1 hypothetical protein [Streptomyces sp. TYQ1024]UBI37577.1 hypothetical protein K7I03_14615 [Streptomyces mobaraensis]UKW30165.1 hypothetical protein MCU78_14580 [Streptomyces sp. TYQ1024]